ncbi:MAG: cytoplasmic protein [Desulfobacterales bacterium]
MKKYSHDFVETYEGLLAFGWDRQTDEQTLICYLQMLSDDRLIKILASRMNEHEIEELHNIINRLLKTHLNDAEYHRLFLKDNTH